MKKSYQKLLGDKDFNELIKGGGISFFFRLGGQALGYLLTLIIANLFGAKGLGDYVLAITILKLFSVLAKFGLDTASIRFIASYATKEKWQSVLNLRKKVVNILSVTTVLSSLLMYFLADSIADLININVKYIRLNAFFVIPMVFFMLHYESLRGLKKIAEFSFFYRMSQALISIIAIVIIYQFTNDSEVPIYAYLTSVLIVSFLAYLSFRYHLIKHANSKIVFTNELLKNDIINKDLFKEQILIAHNSYDGDLFKGKNKSRVNNKVIFVGNLLRFDEERGVDLLIDISCSISRWCSLSAACLSNIFIS